MGAFLRSIAGPLGPAPVLVLAAASAIGLVAAIQLAVWLGLVYWPGFLPILVLPALAGVVVMLRTAPERRAPGALAIAMAVSLLTVCTAPLVGGYTREIVGRAAIALAGWTVILWLAIAAGAWPDAAVRPGRRWADPKWALALVAVALVITAGRHYAMVGRFAVLQDEVLYLLQASWMTEPGYGWALDPGELAFLRPEYTSYREGVLRTQYPPGWPALLAAFSAIGLRWWSPPLLIAAAVGVTWWIGRRLHSPEAGLLAGALTMVQPWMVEAANGYMATAASVFLAVTAAAALLTGERTAGRRRVLAWVAAGLLSGLAVAVRPLSGVAIGVSLVLWIAVRGRLTVRAMLGMAAGLAAGALLPLAGLLYYNTVTNGDPLLFGYQAVHGGLHDLGFGLRGYNLYFGGLDPVAVARPFTFRLAVEAFFARVWEGSAEALPAFLLLPLAWLLVANGRRIRWPTVAVFLALPVAYFFYFFSRIRFYAELVPFVMLGLAVLLVELGTQRPRLVRWVIVLLLAGGAARAVAGPPDEHGRGRSGVLPAARAIDQLADEHERVLVFVREPPTADMDHQEAHLFRRLAFFNAGGFNGRVLVARDAGASNSTLIRRLGAHQPFLLVQESGGAIRIRPMPGPAADETGVARGVPMSTPTR